MKQSKFLFGALIISALFFGSEAVQADPTGDCTTGEFCEQSSLTTTNTTT